MGNTTSLQSLPVDSDLTVASARAKGYHWISDVFPDLPDDILREIAQSVREEGYKLGKASDESEESGLGLYQPLSEGGLPDP